MTTKPEAEKLYTQVEVNAIVRTYQPGAEYTGQVIAYNGHNYTVVDGPEFEFASTADCVNELGQPTMLFLKLDSRGVIVRAATRKGPWQDVTVENMVSVEWIRGRRAVIESAAASGDDEAAHGHEDHLYVEVLRAIAAGVADPAVLAAEAVKATGLEFSRYCA